jgi:hypothetical protein
MGSGVGQVLTRSSGCGVAGVARPRLGVLGRGWRARPRLEPGGAILGPQQVPGTSRKLDSGHISTISITIRVRGARLSVMKPRIQCVLAQWNSGFIVSGRRLAADLMVMINASWPDLRCW